MPWWDVRNGVVWCGLSGLHALLVCFFVFLSPKLMFACVPPSFLSNVFYHSFASFYLLMLVVFYVIYVVSSIMYLCVICVLLGCNKWEGCWELCLYLFWWNHFFSSILLVVFHWFIFTSIGFIIHTMYFKFFHPIGRCSHMIECCVVIVTFTYTCLWYYWSSSLINTLNKWAKRESC